MRAIITQGKGGPEVLSYETVPDPELEAGSVLIKTVACGVNRADILQAGGHYPPPPGISDIIGLEISGHIAAVGEGVTGWHVGDACVALLAGGGYAELVAVPAGQVIVPPHGTDLITAAGLIEVAATVLSNVGQLLHHKADPSPMFLVHGGAGGIGSFAIQYGKALGARVAATAGSATKLRHCVDLGCDLALDYHHDWVTELKSRPENRRGADVILDIMGAKYLEKNVQALAPDGTIITIGLQGGRKGEIDLATLLNKRGTYRATSLRGRPVAQKAQICQQVLHEVWPLIEAGKIKPAPETRFALSQAADALTRLASGDNIGKIILVV